MNFVDKLRAEIPSKEILLSEEIPHTITLKTFHHLFRLPDLRAKWGSFSKERKENIFMYFNHLRGLVEIHDAEHFADWNYWQDWAVDFIINFDVARPRYGNGFDEILGIKKKETK
jgi:hypothetical protein